MPLRDENTHGRTHTQANTQALLLLIYLCGVVNSLCTTNSNTEIQRVTQTQTRIQRDTHTHTLRLRHTHTHTHTDRLRVTQTTGNVVIPIFM